MNPDALKYTETHEWVGEKDGLYVVGITDYAQAQLGDITYVELPAPGRAIQQHEEAAVVESVKAASDVYAPMAGVVAAINEALESQPELVNQDPYGAGWFFTMKDVVAEQLAALMDAAAYKNFLEDNEA